MWLKNNFHVTGVLLLLIYFGYPIVGDKSYYIETDKPLSWPDAFKFCKENNMTLLCIRDDDEFEYLKTILYQRYKRIPRFWLGAQRIEGVFYWQPRGDAVENFMWHSGEPNDKNGNENCIHTWDEDFDWNDDDCDNTQSFICETDG